MAAIPYTTGLQLLLDARTIVASDGDAVAAWADQSGQGNNASQGTALARPTYKTNVFGSKPAVRFGGSQGLVGSLSSFGTVTGFTLLMAMSNLPTSQTSIGGYFGVSRSGTNDYDTFARLEQPDGWYVTGSSRAVPQIPLASLSASPNPVVHGFSVSTTSKMLIVNGPFFVGSHSISMPATPTLFNIGCLYNGSFNTSFSTKYDLFLLALYNGALSASNAESVADWMLTELGVRTAEAGGGYPLIGKGPVS